MKIKIVFMIPYLSSGGAVKVMSFLAQNINPAKYNIKLIVIGFENDRVYNTFDVETLYLKHTHVHEVLCFT